MVKFNQERIDSEISCYQELLLDNLEVADCLLYTMPTIQSHVKELTGKKLSEDEKDLLVDYLLENQERLLEFNFGYHVITNHVSLCSIPEIEVDFSYLNWSDKRRDIVNSESDIYISSDNYGYINSDMHLDILIDKSVINAALKHRV